MKLLFLTGSRSEWGYISPILKICKGKKIKYSICATNMHLLNNYGQSVNEIIKDGYKVDYKIYMSLEGGNHYTMAKSMGIFQSSFVDVLLNEKPDWLILAGDRAETLIGAICGAYTYTPIAHIQAGELSGNIDGMARHAIGKFAHLHFAANADAANRLEKLGEDKFRIHNVGAPQLDELKDNYLLDFPKMRKKYQLKNQDEICLVVFHPLTEEFGEIKKQITLLIDTLNKINLIKFWILPNNDAGFQDIKDEVLYSRREDTKILSNLPRLQYLTLLKNSKFIIGNSSSGILEAPTFKIPAINLGKRQKNRFRGKNIIDVEIINEKYINKAINKAISKRFVDKLKKTSNPYGVGNSSKKIIDIILKTKITKKLLSKHLTY